MQRFDALSLRSRHDAGLTLPELLVGVLVLGLMASTALVGTSRLVARTRVEAAARQLALGLEQARTAAERTGQPCVVGLNDHGWAEPDEGEGTSGLPVCPLSEHRLAPEVQLKHNMPAAMRISSTGLVLDGGTAVLTTAGSDLQRCLVISLPLGVVRIGLSTAVPGAVPRSADCRVDPSL